MNFHRKESQSKKHSQDWDFSRQIKTFGKFGANSCNQCYAETTHHWSSRKNCPVCRVQSAFAANHLS